MFDFGSMIYTVPALLIAITIHEYAHAVTADAALPGALNL